MTKFSIGQKVKIIKTEYKYYLGKVGYVYHIDKDSLPYWVFSRPNGKGENLSYWPASELSLVKPKAKKEKDKLAFMGTFTFPDLREMRASLRKAGWGRSEIKTIISGLKTLPEYQPKKEGKNEKV